MTNPIALRTRSVYRSILRELPRREPSQTILSAPSPLQSRIRQYLSTDAGEEAVARARLDEAQQFVEYVRAQAMYTTLLERYNPGAEMDEQERVRLTARRVGMDLPPEMQNGNGNGNGEK